jgi:hypothetical protein
LIELHRVPCQPGQDCRISNWRRIVSGYRSDCATYSPSTRAMNSRRFIDRDAPMPRARGTWQDIESAQTG